MSIHSVRPTDADDENDQPRPNPRKSVWRAVVVTTWLAATGTGTAWLSTLAAGHPNAGGLRTTFVTAAIIAIIVSCWYSIRRGQSELLDELRRTRPGYSEGYEAGHADGTSGALRNVRPWLPVDLPVTEDNVLRLNGRRRR